MITSERAGVLFRVSDARQDEESQEPSVMGWCAGHQYITSDEMTFVLHGASAFKRNKKFDAVWEKILDAFRTGKITVLVVWQMRRLDRKLEATQMIKQIVELGGRVEFTAPSDQPLNDLSSMGGRINLKLQEEIAYGESLAKSENVKINADNLRKANGVTTRPCYGLRVACEGIPEVHNTKRCGHHKIFVKNTIEARILAKAIDMYMAGKSLVAVCQWLDAEGFKPRQSALWQPKSLAGIFRNPGLIGRTESGKGRGKLLHLHESVMDREPWEALQKEMARRGNDGVIVHRTNTAKLTNVAICDSCGLPMYRTSDNRSYRCHGTPVAPSRCSNSIRMAWLDEWIESKLRHPVHGLGSMKLIKTEVIPGHDNKAAIQKIDDKIRDLDPDMDPSEWMSQVGKLRAQRKTLVDDKTTKPTVRTWESDETIAMHWLTLAPEKRREFLIKLGITIRVRPASVKGHDPLLRVSLHSTDERIGAALAELLAVA